MNNESLGDPGIAVLPILFDAPEVDLIRRGLKTMARKPIKNPPASPVDIHKAEWAEPYANALGFTGCWSFYREMDRESPHRGRSFACNRIAIDTIRCPYGKEGDTLRVVELRTIPGIDGPYRAGSDGRIYSFSTGRANSKREKPFVLALTAGSESYPIITLPRPKRRNYAVHSLVCSAFHGMAPARGMEVRHVDGNRMNNDPANLRWGTRAENEADKRRHRTLACGSRQGSSKLSEDDVDLIRRSVSVGLATVNRAAEHFGVGTGTIRHILAGDCWRGFEGAEDGPPPAYEHIYLRVSRIRVERVGSITPEDAIAEGIGEYAAAHKLAGYYTTAFARLWDSYHPVNLRFDADPWAWTVAWRRVEEGGDA